MQSELMLRNGKRNSRALEDLSYKRRNRIKTNLHRASRMVVSWCVEHKIDTLICGLNKGWKQKCLMGRANTQKFVDVPFDMLIKQLEYKCQSVGIRFVITDEAYTSGTSFLDNEQPIQEQYNRSRRKKRGLFQASDRLINADVNGAMQIIKKVVPNAFCYGIVAVNLTPLILDAA